MKKCSKCSLSKSALEFRSMARSSDGLSAWCIECHKVASKEHYLRNKDKHKKASAAWRENNREKANQISREFHHRNKEARLASNKKWAQINAGARRSNAAARKASLHMAIPAWADLGAIKEIYKLAKQVQEQTGTRTHVDHIVPLKSPLVCGLHCEANLQVIPGAENESKRNFWWPDMPERPAQIQEGLAL